MPSKREPGHYMVGEQHEGQRHRNIGEFGVIRGDTAMDLGYLEWAMFPEESLHSSKWYAYRIGPKRDGSGRCVMTYLLSVEDTKKDAVAYLEQKYSFSKTY